MEGNTMDRLNYNRLLSFFALGLISLVLGAFVLRALEPQQIVRADEQNSQDKPVSLDAEQIGKAAGAKPTTTPDGVVRIAWPRSDVKVSVDGMPLKPFAGLGSWAAFKSFEHGAMVMGDTV